MKKCSKWTVQISKSYTFDLYIDIRYFNRGLGFFIVRSLFFLSLLYPSNCSSSHSYRSCSWFIEFKWGRSVLRYIPWRNCTHRQTTLQLFNKLLLIWYSLYFAFGYELCYGCVIGFLSEGLLNGEYPSTLGWQCLCGGNNMHIFIQWPFQRFLWACIWINNISSIAPQNTNRNRCTVKALSCE